MKSTSLCGQVAIVTGGSSGIGRAIAQALAAGGARVAVAARTLSLAQATATAISRQGGVAEAFMVDVTNFRSVERTVKLVRRTFGPADILVNCAGTVGPVGPVAQSALADWERCIDTNLVGAFRVSRAVLPAMLDRNRGRILNIVGGSIGKSQRPYFTAYHASKAAIVAFTEDLAVEVAPFGVSVFGLYPGSVPTAMANQIAASPWAQALWGMEESLVAARFRTSPDAAAHLSVLLCEGRADSLSGRVVWVPERGSEPGPTLRTSLLRWKDEFVQFGVGAE